MGSLLEQPSPYRNHQSFDWHTASRIYSRRPVQFEAPVTVGIENREMLDEKPAAEKTFRPLGGFLGGFLAAIVLAAVGFVVWQRMSPVATSTSPGNAGSAFAA